jgi:hypothetical protein
MHATWWIIARVQHRFHSIEQRCSTGALHSSAATSHPSLCLLHLFQEQHQINGNFKYCLFIALLFLTQFLPDFGIAKSHATPDLHFYYAAIVIWIRKCTMHRKNSVA